MMRQAAPRSTSVDFTAVGHRDFRDRLRGVMSELEGHVQESDSFWADFGKAGQRAASGGTLVVGDLSELVRAFRRCDVHAWTTRVRRIRPFFLAFVRTERDRSCAALVDDLLRASDMRLNVCNDASDWREISSCLRGAVSALRPEALLEVRFVADRDALLVQFSDGMAGTLSWGDLGIADLRGTLVAESATVGRLGSTVEMATTSGDLFEIDAASARGLLDASFGEAIGGSDSSEAEVGDRLRAARSRVGITQLQLSERTGLDQAAISRMERGQHLPRIDTLRKVAAGLGMTVSDLLLGA